MSLNQLLEQIKLFVEEVKTLKEENEALKSQVDPLKEQISQLERENNILRLKESLTDLLLQSPELQIDYLCFEVIDTTAEHLIKCFSSISASTQEEYFKQCFNKMCK